MAIDISKRANGGFTLVYDGITVYPAGIKYIGNSDGVFLFATGLNFTKYFEPADWTIATVTGFTTVTAVCDALDALGLTSGYDELASMKTALQLLDNAVDGNYLNTNMNIAGTDVAANSGNLSAQTMRVAIATDDVNTAAIKTALQLLDNAVDGNYLNVNQNIAGTDVSGGAGNVAATVQRVTLATDDVNAASINAKLDNGAQKTQLVDDAGVNLSLAVVPAVKTVSITRPANTTTYTAHDSIGEVVAVKKKDTITLTGTSGTANVTLAGGLTKLATFAAGGTTDLTQTAADFVTSHAAAYLAEGIVVTSSGVDIIFESSLAGVSFTSPAITNVTTDLAGTVANTTANVSPTSILLAEVASADGGGLILVDAMIETTATEFAGKKIKIWMFKTVPAYFTGDNDAFVLKWANDMNAVPFIEITMGALLTGSDIVVGTSSPEAIFVCDAAADDMIILLESVDEVTSPASEADFRITFNVTQL